MSISIEELNRMNPESDQRSCTGIKKIRYG